MYLCRIQMVRKRNFHIVPVDTISLNEDTLLEYKEVLSFYPYCQYARLLFLLNLRRIQDETYSTLLPFTAICLPDRSRLKEQVDALQKGLNALYPSPSNDNFVKEKFLSESSSATLPSSQNTSKAKFSPWSQVFVSSMSPLPEEVLQEHTPMVSSSGVSPSGQLLPKAGKRAAFPQKEISVENLQSLLSKTSVSNAKLAVESVAIRERRKNGENEKKINKETRECHSFQKESTKGVSPDELIERFLKNSSEHLLISPDDDKDYSVIDPDTGHSSEEDFTNGSETLAELYLQKGYPEKALKIYKNLSLKFPEKNRYFAKLIKEVNKRLTSK